MDIVISMVQNIVPKKMDHKITQSINQFLRLQTDLRITFSPNIIRMQLYIITSEINSRPFYVGSDFALRNFLFEAVKLTKNEDHGKCSNFGYGISFDVYKQNFFIVKWWVSQECSNTWC